MGNNRERDDAIIKARQAGASFREISRQYGLSNPRVRAIFAIKQRDINYLRESPFKPLGLSKRLLRALTNSEFKMIEQVAISPMRKCGNSQRAKGRFAGDQESYCRLEIGKSAMNSAASKTSNPKTWLETPPPPLQ